MESEIASFGIFQIKEKLLVNECAQYWGAFVGSGSVAEAAQTEPANLQGKPLHSENTARWMRKNTRLGAEVVLLRQWVQLEPAAHIWEVVG